MSIQWKSVARDTLIIFLLTFLGGFVIGFAVASANAPVSMAAIGLSNVLFATVGFCISGCLSPIQRFRHLGVVLAVVWLLGLVNLLIMDNLNILTWIVSLIPLAVAMLVGGGISFLFVRGRGLAEDPIPQDLTELMSKPEMQPNQPFQADRDPRERGPRPLNSNR